MPTIPSVRPGLKNIDAESLKDAPVSTHIASLFVMDEKTGEHGLIIAACRGGKVLSVSSPMNKAEVEAAIRQLQADVNLVFGDKH